MTEAQIRLRKKMIRGEGQFPKGGSSYVGDLEMSYRQISEAFGDIEDDEEWEGFFWNGSFYNIYPTDTDRIWSVSALKRNHHWHIGGAKDIIYPIVLFMVGLLTEYRLVEIIFKHEHGMDIAKSVFVAKK
jgi:hypothetical protein